MVLFSLHLRWKLNYKNIFIHKLAKNLKNAHAIFDIPGCYIMRGYQKCPKTIYHLDKPCIDNSLQISMGICDHLPWGHDLIESKHRPWSPPDIK